MKNRKIRKRILLINPRTPDGCGKSYYLPLGLLYLARICEKSFFSAQLLDFNIYKPYLQKKPDEFCFKIALEKIEEYNPDIILFGCLFSGQFPQVYQLSSIIKKKYSDIFTILGGIHATTYPVEILSHCSGIDCIILGEGEQTLTFLLKELSSEKPNFNDIDGLAFRGDELSIIITEKKQFIVNLDEIPFPAYHLIKIDDYKIDTSGWHNPKNMDIHASIPIITSRGCPMNCSFCPMSFVMGKKFRQRSVENVFSELNFLYSNFGLNYFSFMDDNFTLNKDYVLSLCQKIINENLNIQFDLLNGVSVNTLNREIIDIMAKAGLVRIALAIESGSPLIRKKMGKKLPQEKIYEVANILKEYPNVLVRGFFIIGMPDETNQTLQETYDLINDIGIQCPEISNIIPFKGTPLYKSVLEKKLFFKGFHPEDLWNTPITLGNSNAFFIKPYELSKEELIQWRKKFALIDAKSRLNTVVSSDSE